MKSAWIGIGFSHHSVPSLSNVAMRSSTGHLGDGALDELDDRPLRGAVAPACQRLCHGPKLGSSRRTADRPKRMSRGARVRWRGRTDRGDHGPRPTGAHDLPRGGRRARASAGTVGIVILVAIATLELAVMIAFSRIGRSRRPGRRPDQDGDDPGWGRDGPRTPPPDAPPVCWPEFERQFAEHVPRSRERQAPRARRAAGARLRRAAGAEGGQRAGEEAGRARRRVPVGGGEVEHRALRGHDVAGDRRDRRRTRSRAG